VLVNQEQLRLLKNNTLFKGVPEAYLNSYLKPKNFIQVEDGKILYSCYEETSDLYLVIEGEVKIKFCKEKNIEFKILFDFFGETEILEGGKRLSFAVANSDCVLYKMSTAELK
jgi:CRP-like cAMP-binding protein